MADFTMMRYCPYCGCKWINPDNQLSTGCIVCGACGCEWHQSDEAGRLREAFIAGIGYADDHPADQEDDNDAQAEDLKRYPGAEGEKHGT